jgi:transcriptional regulator with XRE-family HTH domain
MTKPACCSFPPKIGARIRLLRQKQRLSIRTLAAKCGISANTLSLIENEHTSPSVNTLQLLANGLGLPLVAFFEDEKGEPALVYQRQGHRPTVGFANGSLAKLGEGLPPLGAEPILILLDPGQMEGRDISHVGREFLFCLAGSMICTIAGQPYPLTSGDSLLFDASVPHHWQNPHAEPCQLLVLFCQMDTRDQPAERHLGQ